MAAFDEKALNELVMSKVRQTPKGRVDAMLKKIKEAQSPKKVAGDKRL